MKKSVWMVAAMCAAMVGMVTGCFTSAKAYTRVHPDGTRESFVRIVGTGDKASEIAAEGLFADGSESDFGAGVEQAKANQQSTGIKEAFEGVNGLLLGVGRLLARAQSAPAYGSEGETAYSAGGGVSGGGIVSSTAPAKIAGDGVSVVILGNRSTCGYCQTLWSGLDVNEVSSALCGANVIDADAASAPQTYAALRPQGSFSYPLVLVYEGGQLKGQFSGRGLTQAALIEKAKSLTGCGK